MSHEATADNPYTRGIAGFVSSLSYDAIPPQVLARIKLLMLDSLGCAIYGADLEWSRILQQCLGKLDTTQACTVWGTRERLSAPHAALVNGTQVQGFELDDVHRQGVLHVGAVVLPALIAIAELRPGMSGKELARKLTARRPDMKVLFMSAYLAQAFDSDQALEPYAAFLQKPFTREVLTNRIREVLTSNQ